MLFKRRQKPDFVDRVRVIFWPKTGWSRSTRYMLKRILRLSGTPHAIALGFAAGVFASFTPLVGFHFSIGIVVAWIAGGNLIASAFGTFVGNPITFPLIWAGTYRFGNWILGVHPTVNNGIDISAGLFAHSIDIVLPLIKPMIVGSLPVGIIAAILCYFPVRNMIAAYQNRRRARLHAKLKALRARHAEARQALPTAEPQFEDGSSRR